MKLKLNEIKIGERQRLYIGDLSDLDSMSDREVGLILPVVVHKVLDGYELVDGRRRLAKAEALGWQEIEVTVKETMTEVQKNKCELFADIARLDRSWQDKCLSVSKIHFMISKERKEAGLSWGYRQTAIATGFGKTYIGRLLEVAEALSATPKDEEIWKADSFFAGYQVLVKRAEAEARVELERRRAIMNQQQGLIPTPENPAVIVEEESGPWVDMEASPESPVHKVDETSGKPLRVYIQGTPKAFYDCKPGEDFFPDSAYCIIGHKAAPTLLAKQCLLALRPEGFAVFWEPTGNQGLSLSDCWMPWQLIWNKIAYEDSAWPFCKNYEVGWVLSKGETTKNPNPSGSVVSAMPNNDATMPNETGSLPSNVIDFTLKACCPPGMAVITLNSELSVPIAECGHIPIFFEPDKAKFEKVCNDLKEHYERNIPNVEVRMP